MFVTFRTFLSVSCDGDTSMILSDNETYVFAEIVLVIVIHVERCHGRPGRFYRVAPSKPCDTTQLRIVAVALLIKWD